eukprot:snap_masked-scaffold_16-processed-gene-5.48-mRNA-1 protein AED:1.00 eAED:1.00 QI:0/-1/0/0/-1/1/1/0/77
MPQVISETELISTQRLQGFPNFTNQQKVSVKDLSLNLGGFTQYKLSTILKLTHELPSIVILLQEVGQKGVARVERVN